MENVFKKIIDIVTFIIIIVGFVILYFSQRQDSITQQVVSTDTSEFINTVETQGMITKDMYEDFIARLDVTNIIYDINLEHKELAIEPEYRLKTADEVIGDQNSAFTGSNIYHYYPVTTEKPAVTDPIDNSGLTMNTETNESILAGAKNTPAPPGHVHTDDCYEGHNHIPIYGGTDISSVKVYLHVPDMTYVVGEGYVRIIDFHCADCDKIIYTIRYSNQGSSTPYKGSSIFYSYDSAGVATETRYNFDIPGSNKETSPNWKAINNYMNNILNWATNNGSTSANGRYSYSVVFPFDGLSIWDGDGNRSIRPYTGCTYEEGHPNPLACYPAGDMTKKVNVVFFTYSEPNLVYYNFEVNCATCNNNIMKIGSRSYLGGTAGGYGYSTQFRLDKTYWSTTGARVTDFIHFGDSNAGHGAWIADSYFRHYYNYCMSLPGVYRSNESPWKYEYTAKNVDWTMLNLPYIKNAARESTGYKIGTFAYRGCSYCGAFGANYSCGQEGTLVCNQKVVSIVPTHPIQAVYVGERLITTATATYQDGSTKVVLCTTSYVTSAPVNGVPVTISYTDVIGNTVSGIITITVVPKNKTCINGHIYNISNDGSDPGCPYCRAWLSSLMLVYPSSGNLTIYRGTTLQDNGVILLATYMDGRKEYIDSGYINNLDKYYVGTQSVTIGYKGKYAYINVITKRNIIKCPICGRYYELYPDDSDPGCPYCAARIPVFTGNVMKYYAMTYSDEILNAIYGSGAYYFKTGDYFSLTVSNRTKTLGTRLSAPFIHGAPDINIHVECGGTIRDEVNR